mmetsp:Transcript_63104/g.167313  ORF Transcript_63104/g.167313 Transcript_63104/m.167313 type:complete len:81 (-) Transcript_63104:163-405(-)
MLLDGSHQRTSKFVGTWIPQFSLVRLPQIRMTKLSGNFTSLVQIYDRKFDETWHGQARGTASCFVLGTFCRLVGKVGKLW